MNPQWLDAIAKSAAAAGALAFFLWKIKSGYHAVDLKISLDLQRRPLPGDEDCLAIALKLTKGTNGSLSLHDLAARVTWDEEVRLLSFCGISRLSYTTNPANLEVAVKWDKRSTSAPYLNLSPGDETEFACYVKIPRQALCSTEVVVLGLKTGTQWKCQWRASRVSAPDSK